MLDSDHREWYTTNRRVPAGHGGDGIYTDREVHVYGGDVALRLERGGVAVEGFSEPWTEHYPDAEATRSFYYTLFYGASPVEEIHVVGVDGFRAMIPLPEQHTPEGDLAGDVDPDEVDYTLDEYRYRIAEILTGSPEDTLDQRLEQAGISVE